jgi:hypothetical protein
MRNASSNFKEQAHAVVNSLQDDATWLDLINCAAEHQDLLEDRMDYGSETASEELLQEYDAMEAERDLGESG